MTTMPSQDKKPLVSVIIPSYNSAAYVVSAVRSALSQTYHPIEIIVVDDGSTDETKKLLEPFIEEGSIRYHYEENRGLSGARNTGIKLATGEYIALLDADDLFLPEKIERQMDHLLTTPRCDISYSDLYHFWDEEPQQLYKLHYQYYSGDEVLPRLIEKHFIAPLTMVIRRSVFERFGFFDESFRRSEDLEFLVRVTSRGGWICFLNQPLAKLRLRRTGNLQGFTSQPEVKRTTLEIFERLNREVSEEERVRLKLSFHLPRYRLKVALAYLENERKKEAQPFWRQAFSGSGAKRITGKILWLGIRLLPAHILSSLLKRYHLRRQQSLLALVPAEK